MVKSWFRKSAQDLRTAKLLLAQNSKDFWPPLVFHAQQSAEKAIKGFLTFHKIRFPKVHNMDILVELVAKADQKLSLELGQARILTKYAVAYRYPEEKKPPKPLTQSNCEKITALAEKVYNKLAVLTNVTEDAEE